jgi:hypothetical protein
MRESKGGKYRETLQKGRTGALVIGVLIKTGKGGKPQLGKKWAAEIKNKFSELHNRCLNMVRVTA